jgi:hypothetical protein
MSTMPGIIVDTLSRQKKAVQGYDEPPPPLQVRPKYVPGGYVLQHMVICASFETAIAILYCVPVFSIASQPLTQMGRIGESGARTHPIATGGEVQFPSY